MDFADLTHEAVGYLLEKLICYNVDVLQREELIAPLKEHLVPFGEHLTTFGEYLAPFGEHLAPFGAQQNTASATELNRVKHERRHSREHHHGKNL